MWILAAALLSSAVLAAEEKKDENKTMAAGNEVAVIKTTEGEMVCDCRDLTFLDSSGIAMIIAVDDELRLRDRRLRLTNLTGTPRCTLEICGLAERFGIGGPNWSMFLRDQAHE